MGVAESSAGGLIAASLLAVPGASATVLGGAVVYTAAAARAFLAPAGVLAPVGMRGATESFAVYLARSAAAALGSDWAVAETGATGPAPNPYGDPPGHAWVAVRRPDDGVVTAHVLTGSSDREANMVAFASAALQLLARTVEQVGDRPRTG